MAVPFLWTQDKFKLRRCTWIEDVCASGACSTMSQRRNSRGKTQTEVLAEITAALVGRFEMSVLLNQVVDTSMRTLQAKVCSIFLEDREKEPGVVAMMAGSGFAEPLVGIAKYRLGEGFTGFIAEHGEKFNIRSREELESLQVNGRRVWQGKHDSIQWSSQQSEFRNCIALPLKIQNQILGVIKVENKNPQVAPHFSEEDERLFETIANVVALAIENARLHHQIERQLKTIAATAAHRLNNQATNYDGIELDLYDESNNLIPDKDRLRAIHGRVRETTRMLKRITEDFRNYGRPLNLTLTESNINKIIKDEVWLARPPAGIEIEKQLDASLPSVTIDAGRFAEALKELLKNSMTALRKRGQEEGGLIEVSTKMVDTTTDTAGILRQYVVIAIRDNGPGFPPNFPVFEPFHTTDPNSTGLGLASVKELVIEHDGRIAVDLERDSGAYLELWIPVRRKG